MGKLRAAAVPLREHAGAAPFVGIKTGFNDAYLIDTPTKEKLVAADSIAAALFKPYLRGQDVDRWRAEWSGLWMIALKSSGSHPWPWSNAPSGADAEAVFRQAYPALHAHLSNYRAELNRRQDQGEYWWERRSCAYRDRFDQPKLMYQEIHFHPCYLLDTAGMLSNNKVFFLPVADLYLLAHR